MQNPVSPSAAGQGVDDYSDEWSKGEDGGGPAENAVSAAAKAARQDEDSQYQDAWSKLPEGKSDAGDKPTDAGAVTVKSGGDSGSEASTGNEPAPTRSLGLSGVVKASTPTTTGVADKDTSSSSAPVEPISFKEAFANAKAAHDAGTGDRIFDWQGKKYTTDVKGMAQKSSVKAPAAAPASAPAAAPASAPAAAPASAPAAAAFDPSNPRPTPSHPAGSSMGDPVKDFLKPVATKGGVSGSSIADAAKSAGKWLASDPIKSAMKN